MNYIPFKIDGEQLCDIFTPGAAPDTEEEKRKYSIKNRMYPSSIKISSETRSRNAERTANYELPDLLLVNRKAKLEVSWDYLDYEYAKALLAKLQWAYDFKNGEGVVIPKEAPRFSITYYDVVGERTAEMYVGQTIEAELVTALLSRQLIEPEEDADPEAEPQMTEDSRLYFREFRIAFVEF